jgi:hypothetical protein
MDFVARSPAYRRLFPATHPVVLYRTLRDQPKNVYLDPAGNLMITTTADSIGNMPQGMHDAYNHLQKKLAGLTKALADKKKDLTDFAAWEDALTSSGDFVQTDVASETFNSSTTGIKLHLEIIGAVVKALAGAATIGVGFTEVAEVIITKMAKAFEINIQSKDLDKKVAHLLIILEDVFGMPVVNAQLIYTSAKETFTSVQIDKQSGQTQTVSFNYFFQGYSFVDPSNLRNLSDEEHDNWVRQIAAGLS